MEAVMLIFDARNSCGLFNIQYKERGKMSPQKKEEEDIGNVQIHFKMEGYSCKKDISVVILAMKIALDLRYVDGLGCAMRKVLGAKYFPTIMSLFN